MATSEKRLLVEIKSLKLEIGSRVTTLERYKWLILGGAIVIGWILSTNFKFIVQMMSQETGFFRLKNSAGTPGGYFSVGKFFQGDLTS